MEKKYTLIVPLVMLILSIIAMLILAIIGLILWKTSKSKNIIDGKGAEPVKEVSEIDSNHSQKLIAEEVSHNEPAFTSTNSNPKTHVGKSILKKGNTKKTPRNKLKFGESEMKEFHYDVRVDRIKDIEIKKTITK